MSADKHLSPQQFGGGTVPDELDGPLGSYGEPGPAGTGFEGIGVPDRSGTVI